MNVRLYSSVLPGVKLLPSSPPYPTITPEKETYVNCYYQSILTPHSVSCHNKTPQAGDLNLFSHSSRLGSQRSRCQLIQFLMRALFLAVDSCLLTASSCGLPSLSMRREKEPSPIAFSS